MANRSDNFNRTNSNTTINSPSDVMGNYTVQNTWGIDNNQGYSVESVDGGTAGNWAVLESGAADVDVEVTFSVVGYAPGICVRMDTGDVTFIVLYYFAGSLYLESYTAVNTWNTLASPVVVTINSGDVVRVNTSGTTITGYVNDIQQIQATGVTFNQNETQHGLWAYAEVSSRFDNLSIVADTFTSNDRSFLMQAGSGDVAVLRRSIAYSRSLRTKHRGVTSRSITVSTSSEGTRDAAFARTVVTQEPQLHTRSFSETLGIRDGTFGVWAGDPEARQLLTGADFTYLGRYTLNSGDGWPEDLSWGQGLTHRIVDGDLRLLTQIGDSEGTLIELNIEGVSYGTTLTPGTHMVNYWENWHFGGGINVYSGIWWEDLGGGNWRLWNNNSLDYAQEFPQNDYVYCISTHILVDGSPGTVTGERGYWGLEGIGQRAHYGGVRKIPQWFRTANGLTNQPYMSGFGGYTSLLCQGSTGSRGPMLIAIPDLHNYTNDNPDGSIFPHPGEISFEDFRIMADYRCATTNNAGRRLTPIFDWYCSDCRENPPTPPTWPTDYCPIEGCPTDPDENGVPQPGPDGWFTWNTTGGRYHGAGVWIDNDAGTRTRHGLVLILSDGGGNSWYQSSQGHSDYAATEAHIYDPASLSAVLANTLDPDEVVPNNIVNLTPYLVGRGDEQFAEGTLWYGGVAAQFHNGATFVPERNLLIVIRNWAAGGVEGGGGNIESFIDVFSVAGS